MEPGQRFSSQGTPARSASAPRRTDRTNARRSPYSKCPLSTVARPSTEEKIDLVLSRLGEGFRQLLGCREEGSELRARRRDLWREPVEARKAALARALRKAKLGLQLNEHFDRPATFVLRHAWVVEGIVFQRARIEVSFGAAAGLG